MICVNFILPEVLSNFPVLFLIKINAILRSTDATALVGKAHVETETSFASTYSDVFLEFDLIFNLVLHLRMVCSRMFPHLNTCTLMYLIWFLWPLEGPHFSRVLVAASVKDALPIRSGLQLFGLGLGADVHSWCTPGEVLPIWRVTSKPFRSVMEVRARGSRNSHSVCRGSFWPVDFYEVLV